MLTLEDISIAFKGCDGNSKRTFKDHLVSLELTKDDLLKGTIVDNSYNYILSDVEKLLDKALINITSADLLIKSGFFNWGFISSYYANFFSIQALNRLQLDFHVWVGSNILSKVSNYTTQEIEVIRKDSSKNTHEIQFSQYFKSYSGFKVGKAIDRFWAIGIYESSDGTETVLRNEINYAISQKYYYELEIDTPIFNKIIQDNKRSPFESRPSVSTPRNYASNNLRLGVSRIRMLIYILNYLSNVNIQYKSYFERNMKRRNHNINSKFQLSNWLKALLDQWLQFTELDIEKEAIT